MKILSMILLLFGVSQICLSQNAPRLVWEQERPNCEVVLAGVDLLRHELLEAPNSRASIVISGPNNQLNSKLGYELLVRGALSGRRSDISSRVDVVRGAATNALVLGYWIVPKKTAINDASSWDLRVAEGSEPLMLRSDMAQICDPPPIDKMAKDLLASNPKGSLFVVVHGRTFRERQKELRLAKKMLRHFVSNRVRYFLRHSGAAYSDYFFSVGKPPRTAFESYLEIPKGQPHQ